MEDIHVFTSFTLNYLSRAITLSQSVKRMHPDWTFWAIIVDEPLHGVFELEPYFVNFDKVVFAADLYPEIWAGWIFKHHLVEAATGVKGRAALYILDAGADAVIYLDPDIAVFGSLGPVVDRLSTHSVIVTPHQVSPSSTSAAFYDNESTSLRYGTYNLGFLAVRNDLSGRAMLAWWSERLLKIAMTMLSVGYSLIKSLWT